MYKQSIEQTIKNMNMVLEHFDVIYRYTDVDYSIGQCKIAMAIGIGKLNGIKLNKTYEIVEKANTKEIIKILNSIKEQFGNLLQKYNFEEQGENDMKDFENDMDMTIKALREKV